MRRKGLSWAMAAGTTLALGLAVPAAGQTLQVHLEFEGDLADSSASGLDGSLVEGLLGGHSFVEGPSGLALKLDHDPATLTSDMTQGTHVEIPYRLSVEGTIAFWYRVSPYYNYQNLWNTTGNQDDFEMWVYNDGRLRARIDGNVGQVTQQLDGFNKWFHIAYTWKRGDAARLWVDGIERDKDSAVRAIGEAQFDAALLGDMVYLGGGNGGNTYANGAFDDFRIYDGALDEPAILAILALGSPPVDPGDTPELLARFDFEGDAADVSGNGNDGLIVSGALGGYSFVEGPVGQALKFDHDAGTITTDTTDGTYVSVPLTLPESGSIVLWYRVDDFYDYQTIFDNSGDGEDFEMWIYNDGRLRGRIDGNVGQVTHQIVDIPAWYHIAYTWKKGDQARLWIDGVERDVNSGLRGITEEGFDLAVLGDTFFLGGGNPGNTFSNGAFDDVRIYDAPLAGAAIQAIRAEGDPPAIDPGTEDEAKLQIRWDFEDGFEDSSGNGRDGEIVVGALGSYSFVSGPVGKALDLDHDPLTLTSDTIEGAYVGVEYTLTEGGSIVLWYRAAPYYNYQSIWDNSGNADDWEMWIYEDGILRGRIDGGVGQVSHQLGLPNKWYHIAYTWKKSDRARLWIDGVERDVDSSLRIVSAGQFDAALRGNFFYLGGGNGGNRFGTGAFDDFRLYEGRLTEEQIRAIRDEGDPPDDEVVVPVDPGPARLHWPLDGDTVNEGTLGSAYDGILVEGAIGTPTFVPGKIAEGLSLDHGEGPTPMTGGSYVQVQNPLSDAGTIALWYFVRDYYNYQTIWDNSVFENDWEMWVYEDGRLRGRIGQNPASGVVTVDLNSIDGPNRWYHIAFSWDIGDPSAEAVKLYINGQLASAAPITNWVAPGDFFYLAGGNDGNAYGNGVWDDVRIYDRALTQAEVLFILSGTAGCPTDGDTHCDELTIEGPAGGNVPGSYDAIAFGSDDSGDRMIYTFTAEDGVGTRKVVGPQFANVATFDLTEGTWTVKVVVDDQPECDDQAADSVRTAQVTVIPGAGTIEFRRGDGDGSGTIDLTDAIITLQHLFLGDKAPMCKDAADADDSNALDITDAIYILQFLFLGNDDPKPPGPEECGTDPGTDVDHLGCEAYPPCVSSK